MPQRNVTITVHQEKFVDAILASGQYSNVSEVFRAGLRLLEREVQSRLIEREMINRNIDKGIEDIKNGRYFEINSDDELEHYFAEKREARMLNLEGQE